MSNGFIQGEKDDCIDLDWTIMCVHICSLALQCKIYLKYICIFGKTLFLWDFLKALESRLPINLQFSVLKKMPCNILMVY